MHLVFVSSLIPVADPTSGYDIANSVIVDALRALGHQVSVLGFLQSGNEVANPGATSLLGNIEVTNAKVGTAQKLRWLLAAITRNEPVSVAKMHAAENSEIEAALKAIGPFDGLILNSVQLPGAFFNIFSRYPYCFVAHNVEAASAAQNAQNARWLHEKYLFAREANLLRKLEARLCSDAAHVFTLADNDQALLGLTNTGKALTLPLVTSFDQPPALEPRKPAFDLGLIGSWTWAANRVGLDWFLHQVVPLLPGDFQIAVAGNLGQKPEFVPENVNLVGRVPDAREFIRCARLVPLVSRTGTGVQLKTIETFEMGLPSVATLNALRGITAIPDNCVVADDPESYAQAITTMVNRARTGEYLDLDGRAFHTQQIAALKTALAEGLEKLNPVVNNTSMPA